MRRCDTSGGLKTLKSNKRSAMAGDEASMPISHPMNQRGFNGLSPKLLLKIFRKF
jgi:hypothetical protein